MGWTFKKLLSGRSVLPLDFGRRWTELALGRVRPVAPTVARVGYGRPVTSPFPGTPASPSRTGATLSRQRWEPIASPGNCGTAGPFPLGWSSTTSVVSEAASILGTWKRSRRLSMCGGLLPTETSPPLIPSRASALRATFSTATTSECCRTAVDCAVSVRTSGTENGSGPGRPSTVTAPTRPTVSTGTPGCQRTSSPARMASTGSAACAVSATPRPKASALCHGPFARTSVSSLAP